MIITTHYNRAIYVTIMRVLHGGDTDTMKAINAYADKLDLLSRSENALNGVDALNESDMESIITDDDWYMLNDVLQGNVSCAGDMI